jgi:hypothetical protein
MSRAKKEPLKTWDSGNKEYSGRHVSMITEAAENISAGFAWADTREGEEYWLGVYERLHDIANGIDQRVSGFDPAKL